MNLVKKNPIVKSHYPVWNSSPGGVGLLSRHGRNHSVSRILKTLVHRRCGFSMPISDQSAHKFSIKTNCAHPKKKKAKYEKGSACLWCVTLWLRRGSNAASLRFDGSVVSSGERRFQSDAQNTRFPLRGKLNWLLTRHWFAWLHSQLELQFFLLVMDPQVKGSLWFWVPLVRFWTQVH